MKRISIFAFYTPYDFLDEYVVSLIKEVKSNVDYQIVIVNGNLSQEEIDKASSYVDKFMFRENDGFDIAAYRKAFLDNYEFIKEYDQVIFYNQSVFGPIYPFKEMFDTMDKRKVDFWGITRHLGNVSTPDWAKHIGYVPAHLQSYFLAVDKKMFSSEEFYNFFNNLKDIHTYEEAVGRFEIEFTKHFEDLGYTSSEYVSNGETKYLSDYPLMSNPAEVIKKSRCPIAKRKSFIFERNMFQSVYYGNGSRKLYDFINKETDYNFRPIFNNLITTVDLHTLTHSFTPCFLTASVEKEKSNSLIFVWLNQNIKLPEIKNKLQEVKPYADIKLLSDKKEILEGFQDFDCILVKDGFDYLINQLAEDKISHEYVGYFTNDIDKISGSEYDLSSLYNAIDTILNVAYNVKILKENEIFGVLTDFSSYAGKNYYKSFEWKECYQKISGIFKAQGFNFPFGPEIPTVCNGGMFFAKTAAVKLSISLYEQLNDLLKDKFNLKTKDIIIPLVAQSNLYLTALVFTGENMATDLLNMDEAYRNVKRLSQEEGDYGYDIFMDHLRNKVDHYNKHHNHMTINQAFAAKLSLKQKFYIIYHLIFNKEENI